MYGTNYETKQLQTMSDHNYDTDVAEAWRYTTFTPGKVLANNLVYTMLGKVILLNLHPRLLNQASSFITRLVECLSERLLTQGY